MNDVLFSIIVVSYNAGDKLVNTIRSVKKQTFKDYEVIVKDAASTDGCVQALKEELNGWTIADASRVHVYQEADGGIYDGMNAAVKYAKGQYLYFLNCGDELYSETTLEEIWKAIYENKPTDAATTIALLAGTGATKALIYYGDVFDCLRGRKVPSNPKLDDFACYRHVPCHQACLYERSLFAERGYDISYRVRADYEHFLWSYFLKNACPTYIPVTIANYEGAGFSETKESRKLSAKEHREITGKYYSVGKRAVYRMILWLTLQPIRTCIAENRVLGAFYFKLKEAIYHR